MAVLDARPRQSVLSPNDQQVSAMRAPIALVLVLATTSPRVVSSQDASDWVKADYMWAVACFAKREDRGTAGTKRVLELEDGKGKPSTCAVILGNLAARTTKDESLAKDVVSPLAAKLDAEKWPYPIVRYLRTKLDDSALLTLATDDDKRAEAHC
jgi:hypothetical protein